MEESLCRTQPAYIVSIDGLLDGLPKIFTGKVKVTVCYENLVDSSDTVKSAVLDTVNRWDLLLGLANRYSGDNELIQPDLITIEGVCSTDSSYTYYRKRVYELEMTSRMARMITDIVERDVGEFQSE